LTPLHLSTLGYVRTGLTPLRYTIYSSKHTHTHLSHVPVAVSTTCVCVCVCVRTEKGTGTIYCTYIIIFILRVPIYGNARTTTRKRSLFVTITIHSTGCPRRFEMRFRPAGIDAAETRVSEDSSDACNVRDFSQSENDPFYSTIPDDRRDSTDPVETLSNNNRLEKQNKILGNAKHLDGLCRLRV